MAALLRDHPCPACGGRHNFAAGDPSPGPFGFVCPETGGRATLRPEAEAEPVHWPPQGAIPLEPAGHRPGGR